MMRIKLFGLFIAYAVVALVRPRKCLELLEAADAGEALQIATEKQIEITFWPGFKQIICRRRGDANNHEMHGIVNCGVTPTVTEVRRAIDLASKNIAKVEARQHQECPLPPAGWRCTRRAGHDGPCAAVAK